ncbi:MAG: hypothetical protein NTW87_15935 [Planctomycetota bacterium]|nr:hypothetical protein [Planctomycetota bacterium]
MRPVTADAPELKHTLTYVFELTPASKAYSNAAGKGQLVPVRDIVFAKDLVPISRPGFEALLAKDNSPKPNPMKETDKDIEKRAGEVFETHRVGLTTIVKKMNNGIVNIGLGLAVSPELVLTSYGNVQYTYEDGGKFQQVEFSEKGEHKLNQIELVAHSKGNNLALLRTKTPRPAVRTPRVSDGLYLGERIYVLYREFPEVNLGDAAPKQLVKVKYDAKFPWPTKMEIGVTDDAFSFSSLLHSVCVGYATGNLGKEGKLQIAPLAEYSVAGSNGYMVLARKGGILIGAPIADSRGCLCGFLASHSDGNFDMSPSPLVLREFLRQYQVEASKKTAK